MKKSPKKSEEPNYTITPELKKLKKSLETSKESLEKAVVAYEQKSEEYHMAFHDGKNGIALVTLQYEAKIAKIEQKKQKTAMKLAKLQYKAAKKSAIKLARTVEKAEAKEAEKEKTDPE